MHRTARGIAPVLRALTVLATSAVRSAAPLLTVAAAAGSAVTMVGCADENDPMTWVDRLNDQATRPGAVNRLAQFFEDAMTRDSQNREGPTVKPLLDKIVKPLNEVCVKGDLDERTNSNLVKFMSNARHPDGEPCLVKTLKDYKPDSTEEDIRWAARAVGAMKLKSASGPLLEVFTKLKPSKPKAQAMYRDVYDAMIAISDPAWEPTLIANLDKPVSDPKKPQAIQDEVMWSMTTSAQILGNLKSEKAVPSLLKVMLTPTKADAQVTSVLALVKIGKPATAAAIALLKGENKDLATYSRDQMLAPLDEKQRKDEKEIKKAESAYIATAALVLATIGRDESGPPLMEALDKSDDIGRAIIARELPKLPKSDAIVKAFETAFDKTSLTVSLPPAGQNAREALLDAFSTFYDSGMVPWLLKECDTAKGDEQDVAGFKESALLSMLKVAKADQMGDIEKFANGKSIGQDGKPSTVGKAFEEEMKQAKAVLQACGDKVECYLAKMADPASQEEKTQFTGIKSAYMLGVLGGPDVREKIVASFPKVKNAAIRFVAVSIIDYFSPKGDKAIADKLQAIVDEAEQKRDAQMMMANAPFKTVIYRLNAKAQ